MFSELFMKHIIFALLGFLFSTLLAATEEPLREVLLDNDHVQVIRLTYPVATESGVHSHEFPLRSGYVLSGGDIEIINQDGSAQRLSITTGQVMFMPAATHNIKNVGATTIQLLEQELK